MRRYTHHNHYMTIGSDHNWKRHTISYPITCIMSPLLNISNDNGGLLWPITMCMFNISIDLTILCQALSKLNCFDKVLVCYYYIVSWKAFCMYRLHYRIYFPILAAYCEDVQHSFYVILPWICMMFYELFLLAIQHCCNCVQQPGF